MRYAAAQPAFEEGTAHDPDKTCFAIKLITTGIVYNRAAPMKPERWADLVKPEAKGQVIMPSPLYSGAAAIHLGVLTRAPSLGWPYYEALAKSGAQSARGNGGVFDAVERARRAKPLVYILENEPRHAWNLNAARQGERTRPPAPHRGCA
jgi:iron(III) transport system substrate-binding protein